MFHIETFRQAREHSLLKGKYIDILWGSITVQLDFILPKKENIMFLVCLTAA